MLLSFLNKPYPLIEGNKNKLIVSLAFGFFIFLFLYIFKPFGLSTFTPQKVLYSALALGGITFGIICINLLFLHKIFPSFFNEERWTVGKEILITLIHISLIGLGNFIFGFLVLKMAASWGNLFYLETITLSLAILPISVWTLLKQNALLKKNMQEAQVFNAAFHQEEVSVVNETTATDTGADSISLTNKKVIRFTSDNEADYIEAAADKVYFITAADNYIKIILLDEKGFTTKLLRSTLKRTENDLAAYPNFYRCHRAYIVNLEKVDAISGNARGLKLTLKNSPEEIPVSRTLNEEIKEKLKALPSR